MNVVRNRLVGTALALGICLMTPLDNAKASTADYRLVRNSVGLPIGLIYKKEGIEKIGELGVLPIDSVNILVFVSCEDRSLHVGERYMLRRDWNCRDQFAHWPDRLLDYLVSPGGADIPDTPKVKVGLTSPPLGGVDIPDAPKVKVVLTGPPLTCGICVEKPEVLFELPPEVEVIQPEDIRNILDERRSKLHGEPFGVDRVTPENLLKNGDRLYPPPDPPLWRPGGEWEPQEIPEHTFTVPTHRLRDLLDDLDGRGYLGVPLDPGGGLDGGPIGGY